MLTQVRLSGYRVFRDFHADLRALNVVIGANSTGKSTLLDFFQFISQAMVFDLPSAIRHRGGPALVANARFPDEPLRWELRLEFGDSYALYPSETLEPGPRARYHAVLNLRYFMPEELVQSETVWWSDPASAFFGEEKPVLERSGRRAWVYDDQRAEPVALDLAAVRGRSRREEDQPSLFGPEAEEETEGGIARAPRENLAPGSQRPLENLLLSELRGPWTSFPLTFLQTHLGWVLVYPGFDVGPESPCTQPCLIEKNVYLRPDGSNLSGVLHEIFTSRESRELRDNLLDYLRAAYPEFADLTVETAEAATGKVALRWQEHGAPRSFFASELSDGVLRFLCLAAALNNANPPPLIAIDEPEVGLHPRLLPIVADMVKDAADRTQVVVTTHSPDFLDCFDLDDVAVMVRDDNQVFWHRPSSRKELRRLLESVEGESLGDLHRSGELEALP